MKKPQEVDAADSAGVPATGRGMLPMLSHSTKGSPEPGKMKVLFAATIFFLLKEISVEGIFY